MTTGYHPEADKQAEKTNQTVIIMLRCLTAGKYQVTWHVILLEVQWNINTLPARETNHMPFKAIFNIPP